jgi:hypothetical protein
MTHRNLTCTELEQNLPDFLEESLSDSAVADVELHLAACVSCRALVTDLQKIAASARVLPVLVPAVDLWPGIEARIAAKVLPLAARPAPGSARLKLAAAAAVLIAATAFATYRLTTAGTPSVAGRPLVPSAPVAATGERTPALVAPASEATALASNVATVTTPAIAAGAGSRLRPGAGETLSAEIVRLRTIVEEPNNQLDPATLAVIEGSLRAIDSAIVEARSALARDPASRFLSEQLNKSLERKLGLLRTAALLSTRT